MAAAWNARRCPGDLWGGLGDRVPTEGGGSTIVAKVGTCALSCAVLQLLAGTLPFDQFPSAAREHPCKLYQPHTGRPVIHMLAIAAFLLILFDPLCLLPIRLG